MKIRIGNMYGIDFIVEDKSVKFKRGKRYNNFIFCARVAAKKLLEDEKFVSYYKL